MRALLEKYYVSVAFYLERGPPGSPHPVSPSEGKQLKLCSWDDN